MKPKGSRALDFDPDASPFELPPVEGIPYKKGSEEDIAIRRVIEEAEAERRRREEEARITRGGS